MELYSGKVGVLMEEAEELRHEKPLAKTIAVVSVSTATGLFLLAARLSNYVSLRISHRGHLKPILVTAGAPFVAGLVCN